MRIASIKLLMLLICGLFSGVLLAAEEEMEPIEISYVELKPSIVSNLTGGPKYIRTDIQLMTEYASAVELIQLHMPAIRHTILMLIASEDGKVLKTREGKKALRAKALDAVRAEMKELTGRTLVKDLYFTAYYVK